MLRLQPGRQPLSRSHALFTRLWQWAPRRGPLLGRCQASEPLTAAGPRRAGIVAPAAEPCRPRRQPGHTSEPPARHHCRRQRSWPPPGPPPGFNGPSGPLPAGLHWPRHRGSPTHHSPVARSLGRPDGAAGFAARTPSPATSAHLAQSGCSGGSGIELSHLKAWGAAVHTALSQASPQMIKKIRRGKLLQMTNKIHAETKT